MRRFSAPPSPNYAICPQIGIYFFSLHFHLRNSSEYRKIYKYHSYPTPSKGEVIKIPRNASQLTRVNLYADHIRYHAQWRANLFFLLCIAYYKKKRIIQPSRTKIQHGRGCDKLHACHSSILPGLMDFDQQKGVVKENSAIMDRSFLLHWNNMTVLCPNIVNYIDYYFEGFYGSTSDYRRRLLVVLSLISMGVHNPVQGLICFYMIMKIAIENASSDIKNTTERIPKKAMLRVLQLQHQGTFKNANPRTCVPHKAFVERILTKKKSQSWDVAYHNTQQELLTGGEKQAIAFLPRFK